MSQISYLFSYTWLGDNMNAKQPGLILYSEAHTSHLFSFTTVEFYMLEDFSLDSFIFKGKKSQNSIKSCFTVWVVSITFLYNNVKVHFTRLSYKQ